MGLLEACVQKEMFGINRISAEFVYQGQPLIPVNKQPLAVFLFQEPENRSLPEAIPLCVNQFDLWPDQAVAEVWYSSQPVIYLQQGNLRLAHDGETLMGVFQVPDASGDLEPLASQAYYQIFEQVKELGFPYLFRIWNYFPGINQLDTNGLERYRAFCKGRADAFFEGCHFQESYLPAGTGIGSRSGPMTITFMASRKDNRINLENPRQMPAYHYPPSYGPRSPSFARGTLTHRANGGGEFYVSGTASIVGHETLHAEDLQAQCATAFENIALLLDHQNLAKYGLNRHFTTRDMDQIRIYLRYPHHYNKVRDYCSSYLHPKAQVVFLGADICRESLLVEIEGVVFFEQGQVRPMRVHEC